MSFPRYERYKASGVGWLGEVPEHWEVLPLKRVVAVPITDGPHETPQFVDDGIPFVSAEAVSSGRIDFSKIRACISEEDNTRYSQKYSPKLHDIYMVKSGATTGITAIVEDRTNFNIWSPLAVIRCGEEAVPHFVLNFMRSRNFLEAVALNWSFGTQQNIGMRVIENLPCTLPPLSEQQTIAAFLDRETAKIDALIAEQQRLIALLAEKRQATISHAVTKGLNPDAPMKDSGIEWLGEVPEHWRVMQLRRVTVSRCDGPFGSGLKSEHYTEAGVRVIRLQNIRPGGFNGSDEVFIDIDYFKKVLSGHDVVCGDVLIAGLGDDKNTVGRACVAPTGIEPAMVKADCFRYRLEEQQALPKFVAIALSAGADADAGVLSSGSTRSRIPLSVMSTRKLAIPSTNEQKQISNFIQTEATKFDTLTTEAQRAITLLQERRAALISAAVTGKIDVRGYDASSAMEAA
jgi:type I restriction enzyme, S subunit